MLERQVQPGGCIQSYQRDGFSFDTGLHYVGGLAEGQPLHSIFSHLGLMQLPWVRLDADGYDRVTIGNQTFLLAEGYDHFADTLSGYFPQERKDRYHRRLRLAELTLPRPFAHQCAIRTGSEDGTPP